MRSSGTGPTVKIFQLSKILIVQSFLFCLYIGDKMTVTILDFPSIYNCLSVVSDMTFLKSSVEDYM